MVTAAAAVPSIPSAGPFAAFFGGIFWLDSARLRVGWCCWIIPDCGALFCCENSFWGGASSL